MRWQLQHLMFVSCLMFLCIYVTCWLNVTSCHYLSKYEVVLYALIHDHNTTVVFDRDLSHDLIMKTKLKSFIRLLTRLYFFIQCFEEKHNRLIIVNYLINWQNSTTKLLSSKSIKKIEFFFVASRIAFRALMNTE